MGGNKIRGIIKARGWNLTGEQTRGCRLADGPPGVSEGEGAGSLSAHPLQRNSTGGQLFVLERIFFKEMNILNRNTVITEAWTLCVTAGVAALFAELSRVGGG